MPGTYRKNINNRNVVVMQKMEVTYSSASQPPSMSSPVCMRTVRKGVSGEVQGCDDDVRGGEDDDGK